METPPPKIQRQPSEVEAELNLALQEAGLDFSSSLEAFYRRVDPSAVTVEKITRWFASTRALRSQLLTRRESKLIEIPEQTNLEPAAQESSTFESVHERLQKAADININSSDFKWERLVSLHTTEHANDTEDEEKEATAPASLEVNVNSGGIVYFAVFQLGNGEEAAACLKFTPSRLTTQSERLGYELGRHLGVSTPQARIVRSESPEWSEIIRATENVKLQNPDCVKTCDEMLEALEINRCLLLMGYVTGCPLHKYKPPVLTQAIARRIAGSLGRVLLLDLVLRNEDRLPCQQLGWRGNPGNLLCTERTPIGEPLQTKKLEFKVTGRRSIVSGRSVPPIPKHARERTTTITVGTSVEAEQPQRNPPGGRALHLVAIDSGVPRRPPSQKRELDRAQYPRFVEMLLHDFDTSSEVVKEISSCYLETVAEETEKLDMAGVTNAFLSGFQAGLKAMVPLRSFLVKLQRRLDFYLKQFVADIRENLPSDWSPDKSSPSDRLSPQPSPPTLSSADGVSPPLKLERRFTLQLKDYNKLAKVDDGIHDRVEHWDEVLGSEGHKLCQTHDFSTGFLEGGGPHSVVDSYELKVRLEHVLERMELIAQGTETERPSRVLDCLYVGGALAAKSVNILKHVGITHILCLCPIEVGSPEPEVTEHFKYKTCQVLDIEEEDIASHFEEACGYIEDCEKSGGKALVHCFEGKSRSATIVLAYLMLAKGFTLLDAWNLLKGAHPRAQPNDGFMKALGEVDKKLHGGSSSMDWQQRKPAARLCPLCQKNVGLSSNSLQHHVNRYHPH
ncbi:dual specificity protein phosphatase PHS1 [Selaginella moellendorffii]|uniref:dual specificity protein phosphatase PHS1 n=1 Tax=Selaginella moellendorffii TaxID=88036 RepID=UPI000D1C9AF3|nr:dual specificity protein phosphatase PHS1 [Selaginella moellendorffii]|eukprot:XP_024530549.1 dual specificity protein phosphatase PHS1 [Selaginella moellendorffii]